MRVYALRGAIQLQDDTKAAMTQAVHRLLRELISANRLRSHRIIHVVFSQTPDLRSANPATALREMGFASTPLFCAQEPNYSDSLPRTLRVLLLCRAPILSRAYWRRRIHCYLDGAAALRPDLAREVAS